MTVKSSSLPAVLGIVLLSACNNTSSADPGTDTDTSSTAPAATGSAGRPATGAAGSSTSSARGQQPSAAGTAAPAPAVAGRGASAGSPSAGSGSIDESDGGTAEGEPAAGSGGTGPAAGSGAAGSGGVSTAVKPPCLKKPSQMVAVGDSYLNWITHNFPEDFRTAFGEYRMYAVGGASMASGGISGFVPDQLTQAISEDPDILAGVMTGGGNDILIADTVMFPGSDTCKDRLDAPMDKVCQDVIANAMETAKKLMKTAGDAGMRDVVYLFYPHIPGGGFGGMNPNAILDYSLPLARDLCEQAEATTEGKLRCHFIDLVPLFDGKPEWFADDGIHENAMGSAAMAQEVVKVLKETCVAQPESSGCCTP
jgi:lysophospholipase L1-like esterase